MKNFCVCVALLKRSVKEQNVETDKQLWVVLEIGLVGSNEKPGLGLESWDTWGKST